MKIKNLTFKYPKGNKVLFDNFNWELDENNVHFIIGENGSGKTTFYEILAGLLEYEGEINNKIEDKDVLLQLQGVPMLKTIKGKDLADLFLGSDGEFKNINLENVKKSLPRGREEKLEYLWYATYGNMSVGERRWLIIYLLSLLDRELYIFDEPTAGLDVGSAREILTTIGNLSLKRKKKVLVTTHRMEEMAHFKNYSVTFLHKGKNYFTGTKEEFLRKIEKDNDDEIIRNFIEGKFLEEA